MGSGHSFLWYNDMADELARYGALFLLSAVPCSLPLASRNHFSRSEGVLFHLNSLTHKFPWYLLRNLCSLVTLDVLSQVFAAMDIAFC